MTRIVENGVHVGPRPKHRAAWPAAPGQGDEVSVNGHVISRAEIEAEAQHHPAPNPGAALAAAARALAVRELLLQESRRLQLRPCPETEHAGRTETDDDALIRQLLATEVHVPAADEAACRRYYRNNRRRFTTPTLYEARHILLPVAPEDASARAAATAQAVELLARLNATPNAFESLAQAHSVCPSAVQGGALGQIGPGQTVPEFEAALARMQEGQTGPDPIETRYGVHIVKLDRMIAGQPLPFEAVHARIAAYLEAASWSRAVAQYLSLLAGRAELRGIQLNGMQSPLVQ